MTTDELIGALRARAGSSDCTQCEYYNPDENTNLFSEAADLAEWSERHSGQYSGIDARTILPGEMRQGREK